MPSAVVAMPAPNGPVIKRQKLSVDKEPRTTARKPRRPRIFAPFRTVGLVSPTAVPFTASALGKNTFQITTSVGRSLQTYDLRRGLNLVFITRPQTPEIITASVAWKDRVLAAWGGSKSGGARGVWIYKRGKKVEELEMPRALNENITQILVLGPWIVGRCSTRLEIWKSATYEHYTTLQGGSASMLSGGICAMPTYLNKIFAGREDGSVEIWNVSSGKLIYTVLPAASDYGSVTALQPTPALSLLAIAYENGPLVIQDIRADKQVIRLGSTASRSAPTTSISFRTDGLGAGDDGRKAGVMATSCAENGDVTFWDLNGGGRKMGVLRGAHNPPSFSHEGLSVSGGISKTEFLPGQAVLLTSGRDNSLKSWIFDETPFSPVPRILHSRSGHAASVSALEFLPTDADGADAGGKWLLSASRDRSLWGWSLRRDGQSTELSQGNIRKKAKRMGVLSGSITSMEGSISLEDLKAPTITCLAMSLNRDGGMGALPGSNTVWGGAGKGKSAKDAEASGSTGWESVVTGHEGDKFARTWFWGRKKAGRWAFETGDSTAVKSVAMSPCGTFALVGSAGGGIDMFNLQSGLHRQRFPARLTPAQARKLALEVRQAEDSVALGSGNSSKKFARGLGKHTAAVTGIAVDSLNKTVISCGADGKVKFWEFATGTLEHEIDWSPATAISGLRYHRASDLIALSCDDGCIRVVDVSTQRLIRELWAPTPTSATDFCFSNDGRWILAAFPDAIIRIWDLPTGHLIDAIKLKSVCTALAFSNTGEYLATAQADSVGVDIWSNRTLFTHVPTRLISEQEVAEIDAPTASGEGGQGVVDAAYENEDGDTAEIQALPTSSVEQLSDEIISLSLIPRSRWQNLLHLDLIRQRNKPKEPPKAPEKAPFFLPSSVQNRQRPAAEAAKATHDNDLEAERSRVTRMDRLGSRTAFTTLLASASGSGTYGPFVAHLKSLPPAAADIELRSLASQDELAAFVKALTDRLRAKVDFELVQAWMAVFLRLHGDVVAADGHGELRDAVEEWRDEQQREMLRLGGLVGYCSGVVGFLRSARV
ncbi:hypothetical protein LTR04_004877 [Oleoguttula sp. CCFEE 6159]|nr:hypothetical protein LTR04_004877 [Oleoguttula sp. CCFEE 6159]